MSVYRYIAESNPQEAGLYCEKNGLQPNSVEDIARQLEAIVANGGEPALRNILDIHPDKDVILELFGKPIINNPISTQQVPQSQPQIIMVGTDGTKTPTPANNTNKYILIAALIVSVAIISMK